MGQKTLVIKLHFTLEYIVKLRAEISRHFFLLWDNDSISCFLDSEDNKESDIARGTFFFTGPKNSKIIDSDTDSNYTL